MAAAAVAAASTTMLAACGGGGKATPPTGPTRTGPTRPSSAVHGTQQTRRETKPKPKKKAASARAADQGHGPVLAWIRRLQRDLTTLHFYSGPVTGRESPATRSAIVRLQRAGHLKPDGLWGPKSQAALDKLLHRTPSRPAKPLAWIRNLQRDLTRLHFYSGPITGVETNATKIAVIHFQRAVHLKPDGLWGPKSQAALDKKLHRR
jgi:peptidoglycan hydrolase-like protein with peptidoglycan-binding domain